MDTTIDKTKKGRILETYDYNNPFYNNIDLNLRTWESDYYEFPIELPKGNFTGNDEITIKARLVIITKRRDTTYNTTTIETRIELLCEDLTKVKVADRQFSLGRPNSIDAGKVKYHSVGKYTLKYNDDEEIVMYQHNTVDDRSARYSNLQWKSWKGETNKGWSGWGDLMTEEQLNNYRHDINLVHDKNGKVGNLRIAYETEPMIFPLCAPNDSGHGVSYTTVAEITIPSFKFEFGLNDMDFVRDLPVASKLSTDPRFNVVSPKKFGTRFSRYQKYDKSHKIKHYVTVDLANNYNYIVQLSEQNEEKPIVQSYTRVLTDAVLQDDFTLSWIGELFNPKMWSWKTRAELNRHAYFLRQGDIWSAIKKSKESYLDCIITLRTELETAQYKYILSDEDYSGDMINIINELDFNRKTSTNEDGEIVEGDIITRKEIIGTEKSLGLFGNYKSPNLVLKLIYNEPFYKDGVKVSPDSYYEIQSFSMGDFDSSYLDSLTAELELLNEKGNVVSKKKIDLKSDKIYLTDSEAKSAKDKEIFALPKFEDDFGIIYPEIEQDFGDSWGDIDEEKGNENKYLDKILINKDVKLNIQDINAHTINATKDANVILQNESKVKVTIPLNFFIVPSDNSITELSIELNGDINNITYKANTALETTFSKNPHEDGKNIVLLTFRDKENVVQSYRQEFEVLKYSNPISSMEIHYTDVANNILETQLSVSLTDFLSKNILKELKFRYKPSKNNAWSNWYVDSLANDYKIIYNKKVYISNKQAIKDSLSYLENTFDFEIITKDTLEKEHKTTLQNIGLGVPLIFLDENKNSVGFNCFPQKNNTATFKNISFANQNVEISTENDVLHVNSRIIADNIDILEKLSALESKIYDLENK